VVANTLSKMSEPLEAQGEYLEAEPLLRRSLEIREKAGTRGPELASVLEKYAALLRKMDRTTDATQLESRAKAEQTGRPGEESAPIR
jgi:hypothetical protein